MVERLGKAGRTGTLVQGRDILSRDHVRKLQAIQQTAREGMPEAEHTAMG